MSKANFQYGGNEVQYLPILRIFAFVLPSSSESRSYWAEDDILCFPFSNPGMVDSVNSLKGSTLYGNNAGF